MSDFIKPIEWLKTAKRIVVKVGTSVLTDSYQPRVAHTAVESITAQAAALWGHKKEVILVTSGAIGVGMGILGLKRRPTALAQLQAAAATGQGRLMQWYSAAFEKEGLHAAQILLTRDDFDLRRRYLNAQATLSHLLAAGIVPVINENDTVSVEEIRYGDNDVLSAHVAALIDAQILILLSDVDRLEGSTGFPALITEITPELERAARGSAKAVSTGGMRTKLQAAKIALASGIPMVLMNGRRSQVLVKLFFQEELTGSTWFLPRWGTGFRGKERWVAFSKPKGILLVDSGAKEALVKRGSSLLASGVFAVEGNFRKGDVVSVCDTTRHGEFARGIVNYTCAELDKIKSMKSQAVEALLGRKADEVIHRNTLVLLRS